MYRQGQKYKPTLVRPFLHFQARLGRPGQASVEVRSTPRPECCLEMEKNLPIDFHAFQVLMGVLLLTKDTFVYMKGILIHLTHFYETPPLSTSVPLLRILFS